MAFVVSIVSIVTVAVNLCPIFLTGGQEVEFKGGRPCDLVTDTANIPTFSSAFLAGDGDIVANFAIQHAGFLPVGWHVTDELHWRGIFGVIFWSISHHLHR